MLRLLVFFAIAFLTACSSQKSSAPAPRPKPAPKSLPVARPTSEAATIAWLDSERLMPVLEQAQREKKPVFVDFYASWCAPCKVMEEEIFTQQPTYQYMNRHFLNFHTDFDLPAGQTIASLYEVKTLPTVLFLDPQGVVLERHTGMANPSVLKQLGDSALEKMRVKK